MNTKLLRSLFAAVLLMAYSVATAEDIDLFLSPTVTSDDAPNVLIILDNTGNWNTAFENEMAALASTFDGLPLNKFNVGIMMFGAPEIGYVRAAMRPMDVTNKARYSALVNSLDRNADSASARTLARTMSEAYRYLKGLETADSTTTTSRNTERDYTGNNTGTAQSRAIYALPDNALSSSTATRYNSPLNPESCDGRTFIIYIGNNVSSGNVTKDNTSRNAAAGEELEAAGGDTTQIPLTYSSHQDNFADEWARFLKKELNVTTYTLDVNPTPMPGGHNNGMGNSALLQSMARVSGGRYFRVTSEDGGSEIADALNTVFSEIQSVNSVFASVSLPVSVNTQGTYLNQVYVGMFRPDPNSLPRWSGNLKQYRLAQINNELKLVDAYEPTSPADSYHQAINNQTGFITECARSYWTPETLDNYWAFMGFEQTCMAVANSANSNYPDGNMVEKGAQGYVLRSNIARNVKTCSSIPGACTTLTNFDVANTAVTAAMLGASTDVERAALISWARGLDVNDENGNLITTGEMRPSAHGDVVHSRPVAINYGTPESPKVVVFYGGNDGVLRAINGNRTGSIDSVSAGGELWSFMPPEFYSSIKRLRDNNQYITFPGTSAENHARKDYGMDGAVTAYWSDGNNNGTLQDPEDNVWIYATMRRGGRAFYAFDVKNPASPTLKWKKGCPNQANDTDCTSGFSGIGQTWSAPQILKAAGYSSGASPLLIMGGGYDRCEDADNGTANHSCGTNPKGSEIYVLDANTGALLKTFDTERSVIGDIQVVQNSNGLATYAYTADMGGNVYRITIGAEAPIDWTITRIASLGCNSTATCNANRKFLFSPDVVVDPSTGIHHLMIGSGDREKPLNSYEASYGVRNYFFMIKDKPGVEDWLSSESTTCSADIICMNSLLEITTQNDPLQSDLDAKKGWALRMAPHEQVVTSAITVFGTVTFSTHQPAVQTAGVCSSLGISHVYNIEFKNAASANGTEFRSERIVGDGLPPSPVAGMVTLDDGSTVPFIIGGSPNSPLEGATPPPPPSANQPKARVFWNIEQQ